MPLFKKFASISGRENRFPLQGQKISTDRIIVIPNIGEKVLTEKNNRIALNKTNLPPEGIVLSTQ